MKSTYLLIFLSLAIVSIVLVSGCVQQPAKKPLTGSSQNQTKTPANPPVENLSWQCQRCPDFCRDKDSNPIMDISEGGSCICVNKNGACTRETKQIVYIAPEIKPGNFLGPHISVDAYSDWMDYAPMKLKVEEITAGLSNDMDKAQAIAYWVKNSRPYMASALKSNVVSSDEASIANQGGTIIDIFEEKEGVCLDAAILAAAMMRIAGIPAMAVQPSKEGIAPHEVTYFYANGKWWQVDATFVLDPASGQGVVNVQSYDDIAGGMFDVSYASSYLCTDPYHEDIAYREYNRYLAYPVTLSSYGRACLPFLSYYLGSLDNAYLSPRSQDGQYHLLYSLAPASSDSHANLKNRWSNYIIQQDACTAEEIMNPGDYLYCLSLPVGKYNITYHTGNGNGLVAVASLKFEIMDGESKAFTKADFVKEPEATSEQYDTFIKKIGIVLSYS